jgi:hypothetical protein
MATTRGPLFSRSASGTLGDLLNYSPTRRATTARIARRPAAQTSVEQRATTILVKWLQQQWNLISQSDRDTWNAIAATRNLSPNQSYIQINYANYRTEDHGFSQTYPPQSGIPDPLGAPVIASVEGKWIRFTVSSPSPTTLWGVIIAQIDGPSGTGYLQRTIGIITWEITQATLLVGPYEPGTYYFRWNRFDTQGRRNPSWLDPPLQATVT